MNVILFQPEHLQRMQIQGAQIAEVSAFPLSYVQALQAAGTALTAERNGQVLACAGIARTGFGGGTLWAFVAQDSIRHFIKLDRCVRRFLDAQRLRRIEASVEHGFANGCRWLELLDFNCEGPLRSYGPNGEDHIRYARVR